MADTNIAASIVAGLRAAGHDVVHIAERAEDPGDEALLAEAHLEGRVLISKDHDMGRLVFRDASKHVGVMLIDDLGDPRREARLLMAVIAGEGAALSAGAFLRVSAYGVRRGA